MQRAHASAEQLGALTPLAGLSRDRLTELADMAVIERAPRGSDPLAGRQPGRSLFLLQGELLLAFRGGGTLVLVGGTGEGCHALNRRRQPILRSKAITDVDVLALDDEMLDTLATWDQAVRGDSRFMTRAFALSSLKSGALAQLPAPHIEPQRAVAHLLRRLVETDAPQQRLAHQLIEIAAAYAQELAVA